MQVTLSCLKADVGSIGGHTRPSSEMVATVQNAVREAVSRKTILDGLTMFTGDDINCVLAHLQGPLSQVVHLELVHHAFLGATRNAQERGLYAAGQDLLVDAPSGNLRGAGPAVAELTFEHVPTATDTCRPAESFVVFAADKCGPGAYNLPLYLAFADPMYSSGLILSDRQSQGYTFQIIDMDQADHDSLITLQAPEDLYAIAALLRDNERFAIDAIYSRAFPNQQAVAVSAQRLHNIAGRYTGKDDPVAIVRIQGIFPALEEVVMPWVIGHYVAGGARGSHVMPLMPVSKNTAVTGPYCLPVVSAVSFSLAPDGTFSRSAEDVFGNPSWDEVRRRAQEKALGLRQQGFFGPAMLPYGELEYGGIKKIMEQLLPRFQPRS
ncbi:MAG: fructose 1,6-bisphosphatase [Patescibacteria group bacterium]